MLSKRQKILILHIGDSVAVNGTVTETFDLYFNLLENGYDSELVITLPHKYLARVQLRVRRSFNTDFYNFYKNHSYPDSILDELKTKLNDYDFIFLTGTTYLRLDCSNVNAKIITYMSTVSYFHLTQSESLNPLFYSTNFYFLKTPFVDKLLSKFTDISCNCFDYYVPFNEYRLKSLLVSENGEIYCNKQYEDDVMKILAFNIHDYSAISWTRRDYYHRGLNLEIKGKIPFEFNYFQKPVYYDASTKMINDGFTDYLSIFDIDDNISQTILIPFDELRSKLIGYKENNLVLKIINS